MAPHSKRSTAAECLILGIPSLAAIAASWPLDAGPRCDALTSVALVLPVSVLVHALTLAWSRRSPSGAFFGMLLGVVLRALVVVGGGMALYLCTDWYRTRGVALWVWLIGVYLSTIAVEIALQVRALGLAKRERTTG